jgi:hypothetical protein
MLVKALDIPKEDTLAVSGYTNETPLWLQPYLAAAVRSGFTAGLSSRESFGASVAITQSEARLMLQNALDSDAEEVFSEDSNEPLTRAEAAQMLYQAARLAEDAGKKDTI